MKSAGKSTVRVTIFNQSYNVLASGDPGEVEAAAQTVDELMGTIASQAGITDSTRVAVLASMHLADRLRALEKELEVLRGRVDRKSREFAELLDQVVE